MIKADGLVKWYGGMLAVDHVSFEVQKGEVLGFLGPNGAGKSTTMRMLTGYLPMSEGSVSIGGHDMAEDPLAAKALFGYLPENRNLIEKNAELLGIPLEICGTNIFDAVYTIEKSPCYLCARMRRGYLYRFAKEHGCNKIALGHHYDDVIETILMGMLYSGQYQGMMPKLRSTNFEGLELIRPMYLIREKDIIRWRDHNGLRFLQCACRFTEALAQEGISDEPSASKRLETKRLIASLAETIPQVESNLFRATENVVLNKVLGYKINGERHTFLEDY